MNIRRGWTLLEMMAVLAIFAVLLAITIPVLRGVLAKSQSAKNLVNMGLTMKDFFAWSNMHNGRMVNAGVPPGDGQAHWFFGGSEPTSFELQANAYPSQTITWPRVLAHEFGGASPHWQSTHANPEEWHFGDSVRDVSAEFLAQLPSNYYYSATMLTKPDAWRYPGLGLSTNVEFAAYYTYVQIASIAHPAAKGVLRHDFAEPGPGDQRLISLADGSVS